MKRRRIFHIAVLSALITAVFGCSYKGQPLVTIGGEHYTIADFHEHFSFTAAEDSVQRMEKINEFVNKMLMVADAREQSYDKDDVVLTAYETHRKNIIYNAYYEDKVVNKIKVTDKDLQERYRKIIEQYHLTQIVVEEESLAHFIANELKSGIPFDSMLKFSLDTLSENGDIGFFSVIALPPEVLAVVERTEIGSTTDAIKFGEYYYILKVVEHTIQDTPAYDKIKPYIENRIMREKVEVEGPKFLEDLMARSHIEYNPEGLELLLKPDSLITQNDLNTWVVKKILRAETVYVYLNAIKDAVMYQYQQTGIDPERLIDRVLIPDLIYDQAMLENYDQKPHIKLRLRNAMASLIYQKYYSDNIIEKATVDSNEVAAYYDVLKHQYKDKTLDEVYDQIRSRVRDDKINNLRKVLFNKLREKYQPHINQIIVNKLLKEEM
jgi:hypothetical protein